MVQILRVCERLLSGQGQPHHPSGCLSPEERIRAISDVLDWSCKSDVPARERLMGKLVPQHALKESAVKPVKYRPNLSQCI